MAKVVIAFNHSSTNNLYWLPPFYKIGKTEYYIHFAPNVRFDGHTLRANADVIVDFPIEEINHTDPLFESALGKTSHILKRWKKSTQNALVLSAISSGHVEEGVENLLVPKTLGQTDSLHRGSKTRTWLGDIGAGFTDLPDDALVVAKPQLGARGRGQALIPIHVLQLFIEDAFTFSLKELKEKYPMVEFTEPDDLKATEDNLLNHTKHWCITEYIPDIEEEMRVLVAGEVIYLKIRKIQFKNDQKYKQANLDSKVETNAVKYEQIDASHELYPFIQLVLSATQMFYGSIDFFRTSKGQIGFFECCPQFGTWTVPPSVCRHLNEGLLKYLTPKK